MINVTDYRPLPFGAITPTSLAVDREFLASLAVALEEAPRVGEPSDVPEGARYLPLSDTLALTIAERLRTIAQRMA